MIIGVGTDMIEISRVAKAATESFLKKYFTDLEIARYQQLKNNSATIAADFAAKEAVAKAIGTGFRGFSLNEIELLRTAEGQPYIQTYGNCSKICSEKGIHQFHVSLSHSQQYATAFVVAEGGL